MKLDSCNDQRPESNDLEDLLSIKTPISARKRNCVYVASIIKDRLNTATQQGRISQNEAWTYSIPHFLGYFKKMPRQKVVRVHYNRVTGEYLTVMQSELMAVDVYLKDSWGRIGTVTTKLIINDKGNRTEIKDVEKVMQDFGADDIIERSYLKIEFTPKKKEL